MAQEKLLTGRAHWGRLAWPFSSPLLAHHRHAAGAVHWRGRSLAAECCCHPRSVDQRRAPLRRTFGSRLIGSGVAGFYDRALGTAPALVAAFLYAVHAARANLASRRARRDLRTSSVRLRPQGCLTSTNGRQTLRTFIGTASWAGIWRMRTSWSRGASALDSFQKIRRDLAYLVEDGHIVAGAYVLRRQRSGERRGGAVGGFFAASFGGIAHESWTVAGAEGSAGDT